MKNKKQEAFDTGFYDEESFNNEEEEGIDEKILSLDELLNNEVKDSIDDLIDNLIEEIFG